MKPINATKYLRQMKYLPDITPLCGILMCILPLFMTGQIIPILSSGSSFRIPEAKYAHHQPTAYENTPCIKIYEDGAFIFEDKYCKNIDELPRTLIKILKEKKYEMKDHKVLLQIDEDLPWGKVCKIMKVLKDNQIKVIGLITQGTTSFVDFYEQQKLYREKGLRLPESAR
jgi:biopolymer transport protein ExbD